MTQYSVFGQRKTNFNDSNPPPSDQFTELHFYSHLHWSQLIVSCLVFVMKSSVKEYNVFQQ